MIYGFSCRGARAQLTGREAELSVVSLEAGRAEAGYRAAMAGLSSSEVLPDLCEFLVPLAARALADRAEAARDAGMTDPAVLAELRSLVERFPDVVADPGQPTPLMIIQSAMSAWSAAEVGRARQSAGSGDRWLKAAALFEKADCPGWRCTPGAEQLRLYWPAADRREPKGGVP